MDLYLFDFDKTLYAYDFTKGLPALAEFSGVSEYHLAETWWVRGFEERAEAGEWPTAAEYLDEFARVTGARLTLEQWRQARQAASTPIAASVAALAHAATLGRVAVFSNNPSPFLEALPEMAPDVAALVGENLLVSCMLGARKPDPEAFRRALERLDASAETTFFADDSGENVAGAASIGITAHQLEWLDDVPQVDALVNAIDLFAHRSAG